MAIKKASVAKTPAASASEPIKAPSGKAILAAEDNWDQRLGFLMHDVSRLRRIVFDEFMKPLGMTRSQWWVLAHLSRHDGMIQTDLADVLELGKAALGGFVDRLEAAELLERRLDPSDRRIRRIYLTSKGRSVIKQMRQLSHDMSERILNGLALEDRQQLTDMLTTVKKNLLVIKAEAGISD